MKASTSAGDEAVEAVWGVQREQKDRRSLLAEAVGQQRDSFLTDRRAELLRSAQLHLF